MLLPRLGRQHFKTNETFALFFCFVVTLPPTDCSEHFEVVVQACSELAGRNVLPQNFLYVGNISFGVFILTASWQS
jgi:hypothetical protein